MDVVLNWLWQGTIITLTLAAMLRLLERARAQVRAALCWTGLGFVLAMPLVPVLVASGPVPADAAGVPPAPLLAMPDAWWTSSVLLIVAWMVWAGVYALRLVLAAGAVVSAKRGSRAFPQDVERSLRYWSRLRRTGRRAPLVVSDRVTAASVLGCGAPVIAVAPDLIRHLNRDELDAILIHEWAHVQRRDDLSNALQLLVRLVAGWHPAIWWIERRLRIERELACDEMTVETTGAPRAYAASLLKVIALQPARATALPVPGAAGAGLRGRIQRILSPRPVAAPVRARAAVAAMVLAALSIAIGSVRLVEATTIVPPALTRLTIEAVPAVPTDAVAPAIRLDPRPRAAVQNVSSQPLLTTDEPVARALGDVALVAPGADVLITQEPGAARPLESSLLPLSLALAAPTVPESPATAARAPARSPWSPVTDAGVAIARGSGTVGVAAARGWKNAGRAAAGFFSRGATRIGGSF